MQHSATDTPLRQGLAGKLAKSFVDSKLTPLFILASIALGGLAILLLPREEEPQIKVPMVDVMVSASGMGAKEIEQRITTPMEKLIWEIPGVEYIYSMSRPDEALVIVRFLVGEDVERSLVKLNQKLQSNFDKIPAGVSFPLLKPRSIDDVPILALTFHSAFYDHHAIRQVAAEAEWHIKQVPDVSETALIGGTRRHMRVQFDPIALAIRNLDLMSATHRLGQANKESRSGAIISGNRDVVIESGSFLRSAQDIEQVVLGVHNGKPIYVADVATVVDGDEEPSQVVLYGNGASGGAAIQNEESPAVTLTIAKRPGTNAIVVANHVLERLNGLKGKIIPSDIEVTVTRHYGETAAEKSNELLLHMFIAIISVSLLILLSLGWRESLIVALAIPSTLALTLLIFYLAGFTLNRITLFALIFSIGILVDDAIVIVENITRHLHLALNRGRSWLAVAVEAVSEVGNPTILATWAVIAAVLPMAFVGGLMGPYMRPIPIGATAAMLFSLIVAFIVTPWAAVRILKWRRGDSHLGGHGEESEGRTTKLYRVFMGRLIRQPKTRRTFFLVTGIAMAVAMALVAIGWVQVKMLPFDNKSDFQIILNMPEGSTLEKTSQAARDIAAAIRSEKEVTNYQIYVGTAAPFNFNGLVRHYFLRSGAYVADIQVNLVGKDERDFQSHEIAKRVRPKVAAIASRYHAQAAVAETPPGPPVLQTLVAEIYGPSDSGRTALSAEVERIFSETPGVVDVDNYEEADRREEQLIIDFQKAAFHGISVEEINALLRTAVSGATVDLFHDSLTREDVPLRVEIPRGSRASVVDLAGLYLPSPLSGRQVPLSELVTVNAGVVDKTIHHKNLMPVTYVIGDVAGEIESPVYAIQSMNDKLSLLDMTKYGGSAKEITIHNADHPTTTLEPSMKWDGEWHITIEVFRDLGMAFAAVMVLIYILMVGWFGSFVTPLVVMAAIPFSIIGILPAHGAMGAFFTATSMIGFMAGAGIVIRNSIILVDFIELRIKEGMPLADAVIDAGAIRFRPMLLTAGAVIVGAGVILFDPIFQGLAISLMAGEVASLLISRIAVPVLYYLANKKSAAAAERV